MEIASSLRSSQENPPDRNRGEQLKTQAINRLVEVIQEDRDLINPTAILIGFFPV